MVTTTNGNGRHVAKSDLDDMTLDEVKRQRELIERKIELGNLKNRQRLLEAINLAGVGWGSLVDPRETFFDRDDTLGPTPVISAPSDRAAGDNWPLFRDALQHGRLRQQSRIVSRTNSYAKGLLRNMTNYVIGKGFRYKAVSKEKGQVNPADKEKLDQLVAMAQDVIDGFHKDNGWLWREREAYRRTNRDGDAFMRFFFDQEAGRTWVRFVEPECVIDPPGATRQDGWSYGIQHLVERDHGGQVVREDVETVELYFVANHTNPAIGDYVPAAVMLHFKDLDEDSTVKRGLPLFSYDVLDAVRRASKLQRNMSISSAIQAAIAEIQQFESATKSEIQDLANGQTDLTISNPVTGSPQNLQQVDPGTIRRIPKGKTYVPPPFSAGIPNHLQVVQGDLRQASSAVSAPEYMTGDASNANYSSTQEAGAPFIKGGETEQYYYATMFVRAMWRAVEFAVVCGRLPEGVLNLVDIQATGPNILHRDGLQVAQENQIYVQLGCKDRQTVTGEIGGDWETVRANNLEYEEQFGQQGQGLGLGDLLGGGGGEGRQVRESKDANGHEHDASGRFGKGGSGGGGSGRAASVADQHAETEDKLSPEKKTLAGRAADWVKKQYGELETAYGRKGAIAILGATVLLFPVPGSSLVPVAAIGAAKAYRGLKAKQAGTESVGESGDDQALIDAVRKFLQDLCEQTGEEMPDVTDDQIRKAVGDE